MDRHLISRALLTADFFLLVGYLFGSRLIWRRTGPPDKTSRRRRVVGDAIAVFLTAVVVGYFVGNGLFSGF